MIHCDENKNNHDAIYYVHGMLDSFNMFWYSMDGRF